MPNSLSLNPKSSALYVLGQPESGFRCRQGSCSAFPYGVKTRRGCRAGSGSNDCAYRPSNNRANDCATDRLRSPVTGIHARVFIRLSSIRRRDARCRWTLIERL